MAADQHFAADGATIAYEVNGTGRPVGYAHGVLLSRAAIHGLGIFDLGALGSGRRLLTYDQRGHGHSTGRPKPGHYRFEQAADDLLGVIDASGIDEPIDFAGSSLGAAAILHAAVDSPQRFRRLALLIPPVAWESGPLQLRQWYFDTADTLTHPTLILAWDTDPLHPVSTAERLAEIIPDSTLHVARTVDEVRTWTQRTIDFFAP